MQARLSEAIIAYIEHIQQNNSLQITLHPTDPILTSGFSGLFRYNFHTAPLCVFCKQACHRCCVFSQKRILEKCRRLPRYSSFFGICHAGISAMVFPIYAGESCIGYICANGYDSGEARKKRVRHLMRLTGASEEEIEALYSRSVTYEKPDFELLNRLIQPLNCMMVVLYEEMRAALPVLSEEAQFNQRILHYIYQNSTDPLTIDALAKAFHYSRSYISHMFKKNNGVSFSAFLSRVRLENAAQLLSGTTLSVAEVAMQVGFEDPNYFSKAFKRQYQLSPTDYRHLPGGRDSAGSLYVLC